MSETPVRDAPERIDALELVDQILDSAVRSGASDVHFDPTADGGQVRYRIDGFFEAGPKLAAGAYERCLGRLKLVGGVVAYRQDIPQEGRIEREGSGSADLRLSVVPTPFGEKAVVRIFQADQRPRPRRPRFLGAGARPARTAGGSAARCGGGRRPVLERQDDHALRAPPSSPAIARRLGARRDDRGPGRMPTPGSDPGRGR